VSSAVDLLPLVQTLAPTASNRAPINTPRAPLSSPFDLPWKHWLAIEQFVAEVLPPCRYPWPISTPPVSPAFFFPSYPLYFSSVHPPDHLAWYDSP
jgi:hypothetical protein